jgi:hypothetical protein
MFKINPIPIGLCSLAFAATYSFTASAETVGDAGSINPLPSAEQSITWEKLPGNREFSFYEPERAQRMAQNGDSSMRCELVGAGTLTTCAVVAENPADFGFGAAILKLTKFFKAAPSAQDRAVLISVHWSYRGGSTLSTLMTPPSG